MTDDLVAFIRARLDEDEAAAREAIKWGRPDWYCPSTAVVDTGEDWPITTEAGPVAHHIARHGPARVLREIDAKQQMAKLHEPVILRGGAGAQYFETITVCRSCEPPLQFPETAFPCPTLRLLALPYADHPDYREEWAP